MSTTKRLAEYAVVLHPADNVATALRDMPRGEYAGPAGTIGLKEDLRAGFKVALVPIPTGDEVRKYGYRIGRATVDVRAGECVHVHNLASAV